MRASIVIGCWSRQRPKLREFICLSHRLRSIQMVVATGKEMYVDSDVPSIFCSRIQLTAVAGEGGYYPGFEGSEAAVGYPCWVVGELSDFCRDSGDQSGRTSRHMVVSLPTHSGSMTMAGTLFKLQTSHSFCLVLFVVLDTCFPVIPTSYVSCRLGVESGWRRTFRPSMLQQNEIESGSTRIKVAATR